MEDELDAILDTEGDEAPTEREHYGLDEHTWLAIVRGEKEESIGFGGYSDDLEEKRERAHKFNRGETDIKAAKGRSSVSDTAGADAIETLMPDLMEIFTGGDDVATFEPFGPEDEQGAKQETKAVVHVVMNENNGFNLIYDYCKDATLLATGLFKVLPKNDETEEKQFVERALPDTITAFEADGVQVNKTNEYPDGTADIEVIRTSKEERIYIEVVAPEDFTVARDAVELKDATYVAQRSRKRAQDLIAEGYDPVKVLNLGGVDDTDNADREARKTVEQTGEDEGNPALRRMKLVEFNEHYVRVDPEGDGKLRIFQVISDREERVLLSVEEVDGIPYAAGAPIRNPHKFYGTSIMDKMIEVQRIKTSLYRLLLDSGYFALNQRHEIVMRTATADTLDDYKDNAPGRGIRVKERGTITPIGNATLGFDVISAIELIATMGEDRSGIHRAAQGLNPDSLHDTASGAKILIDAAKKRTRLIARLLSVGIKDMYMLVHELLRTQGRQLTLRLNGEYVPIDPSKWGIRKDMAIQIGVGSGSREERLGALESTLQKQLTAVEFQGGLSGPLVTADNIYSALQDYTKEAGLKGGSEKYYSNPAKQPPQPPQPDPEMEKLKAEQQAKQAEMQMKAQEAQTNAQLKQQEAAQRLQLAREEAAAKAQQANQEAQQEMVLAVAKAEAEMALAQQAAEFEQRMAVQQQQHSQELASKQSTEQAKISKNRAGGDLSK